MYSYEDRIRAVELYIDCGKSAATVVRQLGYPASVSYTHLTLPTNREV